MISSEKERNAVGPSKECYTFQRKKIMFSSVYEQEFYKQVLHMNKITNTT